MKEREITKSKACEYKRARFLTALGQTYEKGKEVQQKNLKQGKGGQCTKNDIFVGRLGLGHGIARYGDW